VVIGAEQGDQTEIQAGDALAEAEAIKAQQAAIST
jgi:hypothetical protein